MKTENTPSQDTIATGETIELYTRFGALSRGKCWGKYFPNKKCAQGDFEWVGKAGATLHLEGPGYYIVGSSDGFSRQARAEFYLAPKAPETAIATVAIAAIAASAVLEQMTFGF
jgi:hypothetical protein